MPPFQVVLNYLDVHVVLDLVFEEECDLLLNSKAQIHVSGAVIARSLRNN